MRVLAVAVYEELAVPYLSQVEGDHVHPVQLALAQLTPAAMRQSREVSWELVRLADTVLRQRLQRLPLEPELFPRPESGMPRMVSGQRNKKTWCAGDAAIPASISPLSRGLGLCLNRRIKNRNLCNRLQCFGLQVRSERHAARRDVSRWRGQHQARGGPIHERASDRTRHSQRRRYGSVPTASTRTVPGPLSVITSTPYTVLYLYPRIATVSSGAFIMFPPNVRVLDHMFSKLQAASPVDRPLGREQIQMLSRVLHGARIYTTHGGRVRKYTVAGVHHEGPATIR